jgi:DNA-binding CsgD family transcriptional regulator
MEQNPDVPTARGTVAHLRGPTGHDADSLGRAVETLRGGPRPIALANALADYGEALPSAGDREIGIRAVDEAAILRSLGARGHVRRLQTVLRAATGVRRLWIAAPPRPEDGWEALTDAERRVAYLIADGHTNKSAAAELFLSPNTVATHLRAVFTKLNVSSRLQLAKAVRTAA